MVEEDTAEDGVVKVTAEENVAEVTAEVRCTALEKGTAAKGTAAENMEMERRAARTVKTLPFLSMAPKVAQSGP